jgi:hypothetical protein
VEKSKTTRRVLQVNEKMHTYPSEDTSRKPKGNSYRIRIRFDNP